MSHRNANSHRDSLCLALAIFWVPTAAVAQSKERLLPVPRIVIYGGQSITDESLSEKSFREGELSRLSPASSRGELVGRVAKRTLLPGQPVELSAIKLADCIKQGVPTTAIYEADGLTITGSVVPLRSAAVGEWISFQNSESGAILRGIAQEDGTIRISPP